jgi:hypothetical protein
VQQVERRPAAGPAGALPLAGAGRPGRAHPGAAPGEQAAPDTAVHPDDPRGACTARARTPARRAHRKFRTYPPLTLSAPHCKRYAWDCSPDQRRRDLGASTPSSTTPSCQARARDARGPRARGHRRAAGITLRGKFRGLATYTVEVDAGVRDIHGQTLAKPFRTTFTLAALDASLQLDGVVRDPIVLEPSHAACSTCKASGLTRGRGPLAVARRGPAAPRPQRAQRLRRATTASGSQAARSASERDLRRLGLARRGDDRAAATRELASMPGKLLLLAARSNLIGDDGWKYRQQAEAHRRGHAPGGQRRARQRQRRRPGHRPRDRRAAVRRRADAAHDRTTTQALWSAPATPAAWPSSRTATSSADSRTCWRRRRAATSPTSPLQATVDGSWSSWQHAGSEDSRRARSSSPTASPTSPARRSTCRASCVRRPAAPRAASAVPHATSPATYVVTGPARPRDRQGQGQGRAARHLQRRRPAAADGDLGDHSSSSRCPRLVRRREQLSGTASRSRPTARPSSR